MHPAEFKTDFGRNRVEEGGDEELENLRLAHRICNIVLLRIAGTLLGSYRR